MLNDKIKKIYILKKLESTLINLSNQQPGL